MGKFQQAVDCFSGIKNTGLSPNCQTMKHAARLLLVPIGTTLSPAQVVALQSTIDTACKQDVKSNRWFLSQTIAGIEDKSEDPTMENIPLLGSRFVHYGFNAFDYRFVEGGLHGHKVRTSFNGLQDLYSCFIFDNDTMWGYEDVDPSTGLPIFCPFTLSDLNAFLKVPTGSTTETYIWHIGLSDPDQVQKRIFGIKYNFSLSTIKGLKQVDLTFLGEPASNVFKVGGYTGGGGYDMATSYGSAMANSNYWVLKNAITGAVIPITTLTAQSDGWSITPTIASPNYPGIGQYMTLEWVAPSQLPTGLTSLFESNRITIKRTA